MSSASADSLRRSWFGIVLLLAVIDVVSVSLLLMREQRLMLISQDVTTTSQQWASRNKKVTVLRGLTHKLLEDADVDNADFSQQTADVGQAVAAFVTETQVLRRELASVTTPDAGVFESKLNAISMGVNEIATRRLAAIRYQRNRDYEKASRELAAAAATSARLNRRFEEIEAALNVGQSAIISEQRETAYRIRRTDLAIAGLNLLLIIAAMLARSTPLVAREPASQATTIFTEETRPEIASAPERSRPKPTAPANVAIASVDAEFPPERPAVTVRSSATKSAAVATITTINVDPDAVGDDLQDFPSEDDVARWRRAG